MSAFAYLPEMDWITAVEQGVESGVQPQSSNYTSNVTAYDDTLSGCQLDTTSINNADGAPTIEFKSACRVIEYQEPKSRRKRQIADPQGDRFVCLWSRCESTRTFGRVAELERHYDEQHVRSKVFDCTAVGCPAKGPKGLTRLDKLFKHLETKHSKSTSFLCPVPQCDAGPFPPDLLRVHTKWHNHNKQVSDYVWTTDNATDYRAACPVEGCHEELRFGGHSLSHDHDIDIRKRDASAILAAGYNPTSGFPFCPVCNAELASFESQRDRETLAIHFRHHDYQSLYKYRREILRVWPWFGTTSDFKQPFEDILPTVDRAVACTTPW